MLKSTIFKKVISAAAVAIAAVMFTIPAYSQEASDSLSYVNGTNMSVMVYGGIGYGKSYFGETSGDDISLITGVGDDKAYACEFGSFFNYRFIGANLSYTGVQLNDLKSDISTEYGDGYYMTIDATAGFKLFTEQGDMGYTYLYGGLRYWQLTRNVDRQGTLPNSGYKEKFSGKGWIVGFRDFSTYPVSSFSIVLQTGLSIYSAPIDKDKYDGTNISFSTSKDAGAILELGLGVAFEDLGLSVVASVRSDDNAVVYKVDGNTESTVFDAGYTQFFLTITKDFSI